METILREYKNFWYTDGKWEARAGHYIRNCLDEARVIAAAEGKPITFEFNGVEITVAADSNLSLLDRDRERAMSGYIDKEVGPYPKPELTAEEIAHDEEVERRNKARRAAQSAKYETKALAKAQATEKKLEKAGPL